jgi:hypothetical protein
VKPADDTANECSSGPASPQSAPPVSLPESLRELAQAMERQNELLVQIVAQQADLIAALTHEEDEDDENLFDLAGRKIKS